MGTGMSAGNIKLKRAYEQPLPGDGTRILVDRLWPRGLRKESAAIDHWFKEIAPSTELRKWFGHDPTRWDEFRRRYAAELREHAGQLEEIRKLAGRGPVTLVYAARDELHNDAVIVRDALMRQGHPAPSVSSATAAMAHRDAGEPAPSTPSREPTTKI